MPDLWPFKNYNFLDTVQSNRAKTNQNEAKNLAIFTFFGFLRGNLAKTYHEIKDTTDYHYLHPSRHRFG